MNNRTLLYFLSKANDNLLPDDSQVLNIKDKDWYTSLKPFFNDLIWQYYAERVVFIDDRFKCDDDAETLISKIKRSFAILLKTKDYTFNKLYETTQLEYNPLWNVDGVTGTIHETNGTNGGTHSHTGTDTYNKNTTDTNVRTGKEKRTDNLKHKRDIHVNGDTTENKATYDSTVDAQAPFTPDNQTIDTNVTNDILQDTGYTETEYTNLQDARTYGGYDNTQYNNTMTDSTTNHQTDLDLVIRQGNIGVTKSTELLQDQRETVLFDFYKLVVHECVNTCTYAID